MILTQTFCDSQPKATVTVTNQDGTVVTDQVMSGSCGAFVGMILETVMKPYHKRQLDHHIENTRFSGRTRPEIIKRIRTQPHAPVHQVMKVFNLLKQLPA